MLRFIGTLFARCACCHHTNSPCCHPASVPLPMLGFTVTFLRAVRAPSHEEWSPSSRFSANASCAATAKRARRSARLTVAALRTRQSPGRLRRGLAVRLWIKDHSAVTSCARAASSSGSVMFSAAIAAEFTYRLASSMISYGISLACASPLRIFAAIAPV